MIFRLVFMGKLYQNLVRMYWSCVCILGLLFEIIDRSVMFESRTSSQNRNGVDCFIDFALKSGRNERTIRCPCMIFGKNYIHKCRLGEWTFFSFMRLIGVTLLSCGTVKLFHVPPQEQTLRILFLLANFEIEYVGVSDDEENDDMVGMVFGVENDFVGKPK